MKINVMQKLQPINQRLGPNKFTSRLQMENFEFKIHKGTSLGHPHARP